MRKPSDQFSMHSPSWDKMLQAAARMKGAGLQTQTPAGHLHEVTNFGSNPGALRMFAHVPPRHRDAARAGRGAARMFAERGRLRSRRRLVDAGGSLRLLPAAAGAAGRQQSESLLQLVSAGRQRTRAAARRSRSVRWSTAMVSDHDIDPARVFVTGLSAGGAMTSVMLATYPEVFAGGAIVAGLPYGAANNVQQAFETMFQVAAASGARMGRSGARRVAA